MSTQQPAHAPIPFSISQSLQNIRLLEIPDELLEIITSTSQNIYLKSTPPPPPTSNAKPQVKEGNLHLCTDDKTWLIKQVSTSNSVYVTKSTELHLNDYAIEEDDMAIDSTTSIPTPSLLAIAKPTTILELHPIPSKNHLDTATTHIRNLLPTLSSLTDLPHAPTSSYTLSTIASHIPCPNSTISTALTSLCAFDLPNRGAYIPSPSLLLSTWLAILEAATLTSTPITSSLDTEALLTSVSDSPSTSELTTSLATRLFSPSGYLVHLGIVNPATNNLNDLDCSRWIGNLLLQCADGHAMAKEAFERKWEDGVPAAWVRYCSVEMLEGCCEVRTEAGGGEVVYWRPFVVGGHGVGDGKGGGGVMGAAAGSSGKDSSKDSKKRKWHEKFAAQRDQKR